HLLHGVDAQALRPELLEDRIALVAGIGRGRGHESAAAAREEDEEDEDEADDSVSSLVIEPSNVLTSEDVLAMPELRDVLRSSSTSSCQHHHHHLNQQRPGEMVVLVDETYEFGECENCMDD
ncbi:MAG TPA: hypothetical protein PKK94_25070, partial [Leptospiraceae bacterium]|nr:hypothetical protein [Leptospiraceae bacterium]